MNKKAIAAISGATLLALTTTASAGSVSETSSTAIMPPKHHSYVWRHGWRYGWYRSKNPQYAWYGDKYYAWNPVAAAAGAAVGLAALPLALATGGLPYYNYSYYGYPYYYF
ncbi:MAG: hypothetical protein USCAAHI_02523 [Beijerinckiaceae bacterium]|jgi:hypothetical protein|nr:MAG: hypothetical protein USCAAHI_02523 [Beijerinckiaceae bacterium]